MVGTVVLLRKGIRLDRTLFVKGLLSIVISAGVIWGTYWFIWKPILIHHDNPSRVSNQIMNIATDRHVPFVVPVIKSLFNVPVPLGDYIGIIKNNIIRAGSTNSNYFPFVWVLKTPLPFIFLLAFAVYELIKHRQRKHNENRIVFIVVSVILIVLFMMTGLSSLVRYVMVITPFLAVVSVGSLSFFVKNRRIILYLLLIWYIVGTLSSFPHFISYANELSMQHKYEWFTDSNIDWGQGLISFSEYVKRTKPKQIRFSYFGRDNADRYGFNSDMPWGSYKNDEICTFHTITFPQYSGSAIVAISVTNWHGCGYEKNIEYQWKNVKTVVGESILIF
jgi:hypothetical protein